MVTSTDIENTLTSIEKTEKMKELLNQTGNGFCLAKWKQVTIHLGVGKTHSCHHPSPHKIPLEELKTNPGALHNTLFKKEQRKKMLNGERPKECDYCWRIEDNNNHSDRYYKSSEEWALPYHNEIAKMTGNEDVYPSYLEVNFSNVCNMSCVYCGPEFSSKWVEDLKKNGPVKVLEGTKHEKWTNGFQDLTELIPNRDENEYVTAFWKWFPEAYKHLKTFRITGGEPLMSKQTFRSMDWFIENPNLDMEFAVNTNLSVPKKLWDQFYEKLKELNNNKVKKITIFTSTEGWNERAEYTRRGMNSSLLMERYEQILQLGIRCVVMSAFNILSVTSFKNLLEWIYKMKVKYNKGKNFIVGIDIPYIRYPTALDAKIITPDLIENYLDPCAEFMKNNPADYNDVYGDFHKGFEPHEIMKLDRIVNYCKNRKEDQTVSRYRAEFYDFVNHFDKIENRSFVNVFPEMADFYTLCKTERLNYEHFKSKTQ